MKRRSVGPPFCPAKKTTDAGESVAVDSHKKINNIIDSIFHQFHCRGKVYKRALSCPQNSLKYLPLYSINSSPSDAGPLDLSSRSSRPAPQTSLTKTNKQSPEKEIIWKPLRKHSTPQFSVGKKWFPVKKKVTSSERNKPLVFFPLTKKGINNNHHNFPWTNPLNRIFLQEKNSSEGEETVATQDPQTRNRSTPDSPIQSSSHPKVGPLPAMKATVANPFKITPSSSWPLENNEQPSKPILAPPKFGANSVFGKYSSSSCAAQGKDMKNTTIPTVNIPPLHEAPKPTFKLKPPVLGNTLSTSPLSSKRPASKLDSTSPSSSSPPSSSNTEGSDAKRARISTTEETASEKENPAEINSPEKDNKNSVAEEEEACSSSALSSTPEKSISSSETQKDSPTTPIPTFVPLSNSSNKESPRQEESNSRVNGVGSTPPLSSKVGNAGFIFGQNLENRVSGVSPTSCAIFSNGETSPSSPSSGLFTAAANSIATTSSAADGSKSLSESSREFSMKEESLKTKYEEVQVVTGEEGEKNVIQMNCKLYGWSSGSWQERGRGILRLNDREIRDELHSRLVIRTQGTLTVMLNAKIWAEMSIEKPNDKSVRFTATGTDGQPKIYLVMGSPKDITLLHNSLEYRVAAARSQTLDEKERESDQDQDTVSQLSV